MRKTPPRGRVEKLFFPGGAGVRIDSALYAGYVVPEYYDSLLAKLIVAGKDLEDARRRMALALDEFQIEGVKTTIPLQRYILAHPEFVNWNLDVSFLQRNGIVEALAQRLASERAELAGRGAAIAAVIMESGMSKQTDGETRTDLRGPLVRQEARYYDAL
jgi:acetyl/propionyl-CoA carboxylase alpha subunit